MYQITPLEKIFEQHDERTYEEYLRNVVDRVIFSVPFRSHMLGTEYIKEAIIFIIINGQNRMLISDVYAHLENVFHRKGSAIERSVRHVLSAYKDNTYCKRINAIFGSDVIDERYTPTGKAVIKGIAAQIIHFTHIFYRPCIVWGPNDTPPCAA